MENNNPTVSICCLAYNHEPFIRQCLDGFMMQKTDFPFEVLIHDASKDNLKYNEI
jgi:glycosyltransferase involved in cell wall biosynthesis